MPKKAHTHIQNTAPGPPVATAVATPAMLPLPTQPPMATHTASKGDTCWSLLAFASLLVMLPSVYFITWPKWAMVNNPLRMVK